MTKSSRDEALCTLLTRRNLDISKDKDKYENFRYNNS